MAYAESAGLGIKMEQIIFYIVCFLITMVVLQKALFKPLVAILNKREADIKNALDKKDEIEDHLAHMNKEAEKIRNDAKENARAIIEQANQDLEPHREKLMKQAQAQADQIIVDAKKHSEEILVSARLKSQEEAIDLLKNILAKAMVKFEIGLEEQQKVLAKIINSKL
jgi:F-type H+-transporting ATPase subunit b